MAVIGTQTQNYEDAGTANAQVIDLSKPVLAWYDPTMANGIYPPFVIRHIDVIIPAPGGPFLAGDALSGERVAAEGVGGDSYQDFPLALDGGTANLTVETGAAIDVTVVVGATGYLDLVADPPRLLVDTTLTVTTTGYLDLDGGTGAVFWERNQTLVSADFPLALDGGPITLFLDNIIRILVENSFTLDLDGGPVVVNPVLMPEVCNDLDLAAILCEEFDLVAASVTEIAPEELACLEA